MKTRVAWKAWAVLFTCPYLALAVGPCDTPATLRVVPRTTPGRVTDADPAHHAERLAGADGATARRGAPALHAPDTAELAVTEQPEDGGKKP